MLTARAKQAESAAVASQAESLPPGAKPLVQDTFKASIDSETILNFIF